MSYSVTHLVQVSSILPQHTHGNSHLSITPEMGICTNAQVEAQTRSINTNNHISSFFTLFLVKR